MAHRAAPDDRTGNREIRAEVARMRPRNRAPTSSGDPRPKSSDSNHGCPPATSLPVGRPHAGGDPCEAHATDSDRRRSMAGPPGQRSAMIQPRPNYRRKRPPGGSRVPSHPRRSPGRSKGHGPVPLRNPTRRQGETPGPFGVLAARRRGDPRSRVAAVRMAATPEAGSPPRGAALQPKRGEGLAG